MTIETDATSKLRMRPDGTLGSQMAVLRQSSGVH